MADTTYLRTLLHTTTANNSCFAGLSTQILFDFYGLFPLLCSSLSSKLFVNLEQKSNKDDFKKVANFLSKNKYWVNL
jgi:hypothetical protein